MSENNGKINAHILDFFCFVLLNITVDTSAQSFFTFTYTGPDTLYVDENCGAVLDWGHPQTPQVEYDAPPGGVLLFFDIMSISGGYEIGDTVPAGETVTVTYEALDNQGNFEFFSFSLPVVDTIPPTVDWSNISDSLTVFCFDDLSWDTLAASDNCTAEEDLVWDVFLLDSLTPCTGGQTYRVFSVSDAFGNANLYEQFLEIVRDTSAPEIISFPNDTLIYCENVESSISVWIENQLLQIDATDGLCDSIRYSVDSTLLATFDTLCGSIEVPFYATDACGNESEVRAQLTILDTLPPNLLAPARDTVISCAGANGQELFDDWLADRGGMRVEENCELIESFSPENISFGDFCNQEVEVTFMASDRCGDQVVSSATFELVDTVPPAFSSNPNNLISSCANENYLEKAESWLSSFGGGEVSDFCAPDSLIESTYRIDGLEYTLSQVLDSLEIQASQGCRDGVFVGANELDNVLISLEVDFLFRDPCGNTLESEPRFLALIDSQDPVVLESSRDTTINCSDSLSVRMGLLNWYDDRAGLRVSDDCGAVFRRPSISRDSIWQKYLSLNASSCGFTGDLLLEFSVEDLCGRLGAPQQAVFSVIDTLAPIISNEGIDLNLSCSGFARDSLITWLDNGAFTVFDEDCGNVQLDTFSWSDSDGRSGEGLPGQGPYPEIDDVGCSYAIEVEFSAKDACGNTAFYSRTFSLIDTTPPQFINFPDSVTLDCDEEAVTDVENVVDACFPEIVMIEVTDDTMRGVDPGACDYYEFEILRSITASDHCGNSGVMQQHIFYMDNNAPTFVAPVDTATTCESYEAGELLNMPTGLLDNCGSPVDVSYTDSLHQRDCGFLVFRHWVVQDVCENKSTYIQRIEVEDEQPPVFEVNPESSVVYCNGSIPNAEQFFLEFLDTLSVEFSDACSFVDGFAALPNSYNLSDSSTWPGSLPANFNWNCGAYTSDTLYYIELDYVIYDGCGQAVSQPFSFAVLDTVTPAISCTSDTTIYLTSGSCERDFTPPAPTIDWGCSDESTILLVSLNSSLPIETLSPDTLTFRLSPGEHVISYRAESCNKNRDSCSFRIHLLDTIRPQISCPSDTSVFLPPDSCSLSLDIPLPLSLSDNCSLSDSLIIYSDRAFSNSSWAVGDSGLPRETLVGGENQITFELRDSSGNASFCSYTYELIDTTAPEANCRPALVRVNPSGVLETEIDPTLFDLNSFDACDIDSMATKPSKIDCSLAGVDTSILFFVFDAYGNVDSCETIMRIETEVLEPGFELNICNPDTLRLQANPPPPANIYTYSWTGPNNFSSNQQNPILTGVDSQNSGTYELRIEGIGGCEAFGAVTVLIGDDIIPDINVNFPTQCEGQEIRLISNPYAGTVTYKWFEGLPPNGVEIGSSSVPFFTFTPTIGGHDYYVVVETSECTSIPSVPVEVEIITQPQAEVLEDLIVVCEDDDIILRGINKGPGFEYSWVGPNGYFSDLAMPPAIQNVSQSNAGTYQFISEIGECVSQPVEVEVIVNERPSVGIFEPKGVICEGDAFSLRLSSPLEGDQYRWLDPQQNPRTTQEPEVSISQAEIFMTGTWSVEVERNGCISDTTGEIDIAIEALPSLQIEQTGSLCEGDTLNLSVAEIDGADYSWDTPEGILSGSEIKVLARSGTYFVDYISANGCEADSQIEIETITPPSITAISNTAVSCLEKESDIELRASVFPMDTGVFTYQWRGPSGFRDDEKIGLIENVSEINVGWYTLAVLNAGCPSFLDSTFVDFTIVPDAPTIVGETIYCEGDTLDLSTENEGGDDIQYFWLAERGDTLTQDNKLQWVLTDPSFEGYYQVRAERNDCPGAFSDSVFIRVIPRPDIPDIDGDLDICEGDTLSLKPSPTNNSLDYRWLFENFDTVETTEVFQIDVGQEWTGNVRLEAFREGCSSGISNAAFLRVKSKPSVPVIDSVSDGVCLLDEDFEIEVCVSESSTESGVNYQWFDASTFTAISEQSGDLCFTLNQNEDWSPGQNSYVVRAGRSGCISDFSLPVNVEATLPRDFDPMAGVGDTICGGESFFAQALPPMGGTGHWTVALGDAQFVSPSNSQTEIFGFDLGENILAWNLTDGFCSNYVSDSITIWYDDYPLAEPDFFITPYNERKRLEVLENDQFELDVTIEITDDPDFGIIQNQVSEFLYFPRNGFIGNDTTVYQLCSELCPNLCEEAEVVIQVGDETLCDIPSIFTPNNDGINDIFIIQCLSSDDYPDNKLVIFNQNGSEVFYAAPYQNDWRGQYNGKDLPVGTYFYILDFGEGQPPERGFLVLKR